MRIKGPFTLFLCIILFLYLLVAPFYLFPIDRDQLINGEKEEVGWQGVITLWDIPRPTILGSTYGWIKGRISAFEEENPGVFINVRELNYENNEELILQAITEEDGPDILPLYVNDKPIPLEYIEPLDQWMSEEIKGQIRGELMQGVTYQDKIYGMPFSIAGNVVLINTDLLQSLNCNITTKEPWSYGAFIDLLKSIKAAEGEEDILSFDAYLGKGQGSLISILLSDGGQIFQQDQQRFAFYQPEMISGLQKLLNIKKTGSTHEDFGIREKQEVHKDFLENQKTAILAADSSLIYVLERLKKEGEGFSYRVMPFPKGNMDIPIWYSHNISAYAMMKNENKEKQEVVRKFLEFLVQEESQKSLKAVGSFPVNKDIKDLYDEDPLVEEWFKIGYEYQTHPLHPQWEDIENQLIESIQSVLTEQDTPTQSFKSLQNYLIE